MSRIEVYRKHRQQELAKKGFVEGKRKSLWWGPHPWEKDGGAVVNYYLLRKLNYLEPTHQFYGIPKSPNEINANALPFIRYFGLREFSGISQLINEQKIPLTILFHIPHDQFDNVIDPIHDVGGKIINHQTIHWPDDSIFQSNRLGDIDHWIAPTHFASTILSTVGRIPMNKITMIPHGVDTEKFYPHKTAIRSMLGIPENEKIIYIAGRCSLEKGIQQIIPIAQKLTEQYNANIIIRASSFKGLPQSEKMALIFNHLAKKNSRIYFLSDWYETAFIEQLTAECDIVLTPSGHEGFSLVPLEGMACAKPVAASLIPVHAELLTPRNHYCGILMECTEHTIFVNQWQEKKRSVQVPSSDLIYGTLQYLLENPDECKYMGQKGYERAREIYDLTKVAIAWLKLIDDLAPSDYDMDIEIKKRLLEIKE